MGCAVAAIGSGEVFFGAENDPHTPKPSRPQSATYMLLNRVSQNSGAGTPAPNTFGTPAGVSGTPGDN